MVLRFSLILAFFLYLGACSPIHHIRGNLPTDEVLAQIKIGQQTREQVRAILGPPTIQQQFRGDGWYYVGERTKNVAFFLPEIIERKVIFITFDAKDVVQSIDMRDATEETVVTIVERKTPTLGRDPSLFKELFSTFGKIDQGKHTGGYVHSKQETAAGAHNIE